MIDYRAKRERRNRLLDRYGSQLEAFVDEAGGLTVKVFDTGIGIAAEDIGKAMAPFEQVDSTLGRKYDGTGLGLPRSKAFTELHDGCVELESEVGVGTTVIVRFPAERVRVNRGAQVA